VAAVAFDSGCRIAARTIHVPALILLGDQDDWTPAPPRQQRAERVGDPKRLEVVVHPGATRRSDYFGARDAIGLSGIRHRPRRDATAASDADAKAFLARRLKG
jgi:dienelactone hydrolase